MQGTLSRGKGCCAVSSPGALQGTLSRGKGYCAVSSPWGPAGDPRTRIEEVGWNWQVRGALQEPQLCASPSHLLRCQDPASFNLTLASSSLLLGGLSHSVCRAG